MSGPPLLEVAGLTKRFAGAARPAVEDVGFTVEAGEIFALIGPSGCGKTTTLRMIAGFERAAAGSIAVDGRDVTALPPERRRIGIVFQDYSLFPHLTVAGNIGFGLTATGRAERAAEIARLAAMAGLEGLEGRYPDQLSGGQQQRVALARSLAARPRVLLLDEPFSNLDTVLRRNTRREIRAILKASGIGVVMVTHDQEEALSFADRLALMHEGRIEQSGAPEEVYRQPGTAFAARFLGRTNLIEGEAEGDVARTALGLVPIAGGPARGRVLLSLRPEHLVPGEASEGVAGLIVGRDFKGHDLTYWVEVGGVEYQVDAMNGPLLRPGETVGLTVRAPATVVKAAG